LEENYKVQLEVFEGPLDLLLFLVKKEEMDIYDLRLERITQQYLEYMEAFKMLSIDLASEFVVMAANLIYIKSRALLPKNVQTPEEEAEEDDPRWELIRQLIEYKKFKDAARFLQRRAQQNEYFFPAVPEAPEGMVVDDGKEALPEIGIFELINAFNKLVTKFDKKPEPDFHEIYDDRYTVSDRIEWLLENVPPGKEVVFTALFGRAESRDEMIVSFIALLELVKLKQLSVRQSSLLAAIVVVRVVS
jgi:segregation and condensation protein A